MKHVLLKDVCRITMGQSPASSSYNAAGRGIPFFQGNADFGERHPNTRLWCDAPAKTAQAGDILLSVRAPIGAVNIASETCCIGRGLAALTPNPSKVFPLFAYWFLISQNAELNRHGTGSTFKAISKSILENIEIFVPTMDTQKHIASTLETIDKIRRLRRAQLSALDTLVKSRFVEMFGAPQLNHRGYPVHRLSEHIEFLTSGSRGWARYCTEKGSEWFITIKNVKNCKISTENMQSIDAPDNAEATRTRVQEGDLLISITADLGRTGVVSKEIADHGAYINQHLTCIRLKKNVLDPLFVAFFMESPAGKEQFEAKNQNGVKAGLNFSSINSLNVLVPPTQLQRAFVDFATNVERAQASIRASLAETQTLFDSLMQEYFG